MTSRHCASLTSDEDRTAAFEEAPIWDRRSSDPDSIARPLCSQHSAVLITSMHADASSATATGGANDTTDEILLRALARTSDLWIEVRELSSGRARDCSGEVSQRLFLVDEHRGLQSRGTDGCLA